MTSIARTIEKKVAVIQMVSSADVEENIDKALELIGQASSQGADWVVLPEYWSLLSTEEKEKLAIREAYGKGRLQEILSKAASRLKLVIFGGSLSLSSPEKDKVFNSMLVFDRQGKIISRYDNGTYSSTKERTKTIKRTIQSNQAVE